ncbi:MAG: hypothetical protein NTY20_06095 [Candidatus Aenigmarchaeota archaeon]|nr:hypothetical protein [Candidatus Aenigmarchaeota archaeon]
MTDNLFYLIYLLPGFLVYAISYRLLNYSDKKDPFETTFLSLFLSLLVYIGLNYFQSLGYIVLTNVDWILGIILTSLIASLSALSIVVVKYILPRLERFTQTFDTVKSSTKDIFTDILDDILREKKDLASKYGIWLAICTKDDKIFTGYLNRQGAISEDKKGVYIKKVKQIGGKRSNFKIKEFEGMLFLEDQIKWISIIKYNFKRGVK